MYLGCSDYVFKLCTWGAVTWGAILKIYCVVKLCSCSVVTIYSSCVLGVKLLCILAMYQGCISCILAVYCGCSDSILAKYWTHSECVF